MDLKVTLTHRELVELIAILRVHLNGMDCLDPEQRELCGIDEDILLLNKFERARCNYLYR